MTLLPLDELLALVGQLDDSLGEDTARERFRRYLRENITSLERLRGYVSQCAGRDSTQYERALQDIVNQIGVFLGFDVSFGPYQGLPGQIGFDGRWATAAGLDIFVELKTVETFSARRPTLARSIERLITEGEIPDWHHALGLYVMAREDIVSTHLEKLILDEPQTHRLRTISIESLGTLAELVGNEALSQTDVVTLLRSAAPSTDSQIELVARLANHRGAKEPAEEQPSDREPRSRSHTGASDQGGAEPRAGHAATEFGDVLDCTLDWIATALNAFFGIDAPTQRESESDPTPRP